MASISEAHESAGLDSPASDPMVRRVMAGISHEHGTAHRRKLPVRSYDLKLIADHIPLSPVGIRDKALLLFGFAGAFRRSELVAVAISTFFVRV